MPVLVDCHTHTTFSDGNASLEENFAAAHAAGIRTMCCTDHLARPAFMDCAIDEARIADLQRRIEEARSAYPSLEIISGFEADWYPGCEADIEDVRGSATFILGSLHYLDEYAIDWSEDMRIWESLGAQGVWQHYVHDWCTACFCPAFDSMAHPDLPRIFSLQGYAPTFDMQPLWNSMAEAAHAAGIHVELSTAGLRKDFADFYPQRELLEAFHAAGVPLTVGSDAHEARHVGFGIQRAYAYAASVGYTYIEAPTAQGDWQRIEII